MTPKEKAEELVSKYSIWIDDTGCGWNIDCAKQCALIAVDEIIDNGIKWMPEIDWWMEVKKEIQKL